MNEVAFPSIEVVGEAYLTRVRGFFFETERWGSKPSDFLRFASWTCGNCEDDAAGGSDLTIGKTGKEEDVDDG